jgi:hypothetical protein
MLPLCLILALAAPKFVLAATPTRVLGGHLAVRLPAGARIEGDDPGVMAAPDADVDLTLAVLRRGRVRLTMAVSEGYALAGADLEGGVRAHLKEDPALPGSKLAPLPVAPPLRGVSVSPPPPRGHEERTLVLAAYLAHPDGTVQRAGFFVNRAGVKDAATWAGLAAVWAASFTAGTRHLPAQAGDRSLGGEATVTVPAGFLLSTQDGPDFTVHHLRRLLPLGKPAEECGVYLGSFPSYQHEQAEVPAAEVRKEPGKLLGRTTEWHVWTRAAETTAEAQVSLDEAPDAERLHVFCSAGNPRSISDLRAIAATIRRTPHR